MSTIVAGVRTPTRESRGHRGLAVLALLAYVALSLIFFGHRGSWTRDFFGELGDPVSYVWFLNWWPFALSHHLNPFVSRYVWYPGGFNVTWAGSVPAVALVGWPLTLLGGPVLTYNFWALAGPPLSAWTAFLLARYLTRDWAASLVGGYLFGFSSYELAQMIGHLAITLAFLVPLAALLCVRRARGEVRRWPFVAGLAVILAVQLGLSTEVLATLCVLGAMTWFIFLASAPSGDRASLVPLAPDILMAGAGAAILAAPFLFYVVKGLGQVPPVINSPTTYSADLLNFIIPTNVTRIGRSIFANVAGNLAPARAIAEQNAYLGLPLLLLLAFYFRDNITSRYARALLITLLALATLSLGPWLHINGIRTGLPMPWLLALRLPFIRSALPCRFAMYVSLGAAVATAFYLAGAGAPGWRVWRFALAGVACLFLLPNTRVYAWSTWPTEPFFTPQVVERSMGRRANVLIFPTGVLSPALAWQVDARMGFTQAEGYVGFPPNRERGWWLFLDSLVPGTPGSDFGNELAAFCATHQVNYILAGPGTLASLIAAIKAEHWSSETEQGTLVTPVPPPAALRYSYITGDYWPSAARLNWIGRSARIVIHGKPSILTISGGERPVRELVRVTISFASRKIVYEIGQSSKIDTPLPPTATIDISASSTFVPADVLHNGDPRHLSVLVALRPEPTGAPGTWSGD